MSNKPNVSFIDTREWDFKARTQQVDLFTEDLDRTSATDFFNRTNGLGSPEFYQQRRLKELEEKENAKNRGRMQTRRSQLTQQKSDPKKVLNAADLNARKKPVENLSKQLSSIHLKTIAVPEREDVAKARRESRSNSITRAAVPTSKREPLSQRVPVIAVPKRTEDVAKARREPRSNSITRVAVPTASKREQPLSQRVPVIPVPKRAENVTKARRETRSNSITRAPVPAASKRESMSQRPPIVTVSKREPIVTRGAMPIASKRESLTQRPPIAVVPQREPIITRSKQREIRRFSFMQPTEASRRRSVNPEKSTLI